MKLIKYFLLIALLTGSSIKSSLVLANTPFSFSVENDSTAKEKKEAKEKIKYFRQKQDSVLAAKANYIQQDPKGVLQTSQMELGGVQTMGLTDGLMMHLTLDNNASDVSGNGNNGTPAGSYSYIPSGYIDQAIHCNGTSNSTSNTTGGHVNLPDLNIGSKTNFTLSLWVNDQKSTPEEGLIWIGDWHSGWGGIAHMFGKTIFNVGAVGTSSGGIAFSYEPDDLNTWVMYTLVYDNGVIKAYKNGQLKGTVSKTVYMPNDHLIGLGRHWWGGSGQGTSTRYTGDIDDFRVYDRSLTDSEVQELYSGSSYSGLALSTDKNYILQQIPREAGVSSTTDLTTLSPEQLRNSISYYDGLGRPSQEIAIHNGPGYEDVIVPKKYDDYGREKWQYLPYSGTGDGSYHTTGTTEAESYYQSLKGDNKPYSTIVYENSPLNRQLKQGAPGAAWQPNENISIDDRSIVKQYKSNGANEVYLWELNTSGIPKIASTRYYVANELYKNITQDEHNNRIIEYVDKEGRTILKKVQVDSSPSETSHTGWACTYYIYDDFGNLRYVLPPELIKTLGNSLAANYTISSTHLNNWAFQYKYDERQRMVEKWVPGMSGWIYMVYDSRDRLVLTQDPVQRATNQWTFTKYDQLNRPVLTGHKVISSPTTRSGVQNNVNTYYTINPTKFHENRTGNSTGADHGYTDQSYPTAIATNEYLSVTYYDDYGFVSNTTTYGFPSQSAPYSGNVKLDKPIGQVTGSKIRNINDVTKWYEGAVYYDRNYRVIYTVSQNHMSGLEKTHSLYDFIGNLTNSKYVHTASGQPSLTVDKVFMYDHADRLTEITYEINGSGTPITVAKNEYNAIGELIAKKLHSTDGSTFFQNLDYSYNIRGWLTNINDPNIVSLTGDYFGMKLNYNTTNASSALGSVAQFNGNISEIHWKNAQDNTRKTYGFKYDRLNRLTNSTYGEGTSYTTKKNYFNENVTGYDYNGNIKYLNRNGNGTNVNNIDLLTLNYGTSPNHSNRLLSVSDGAPAADKPLGFNDGNTGTDYTYDVNGNMTKDLNKGISSITYNHLNLPKVVTFNTAGKSVQYVYDANGTKLQKIVTDGTTKTTNYVGGLIYEGTTDKFLNTEEGRIVLKEGGTTKVEYQYHLKDHLGNVRLTFTTGGGTTSTIMATMEAQNAEQEETAFANIENTRQVDELYNITEGGNTSARLNAAEGKVMGPWTSVHVMAGDTVRLSVFAKYDQPTKTREAVMGMGGIIATTITGAKTVDAVREMANTIGESLQGGQASLLAKDNNVPKAYLNYIFFDKEMNSKKTNFKQVTEAAHGSFEELEMEFIAKEEGYLMAYTSNETNEDLNVFMDQMSLNHTTGPIVRVDDYYPFGLTFKSSELNGKLTNKFLYNGKEKEELTEWYDYGARMYQADLGRFFTQDRFAEKYLDFTPYQYAANNPIMFIDVNGDSINVALIQRYDAANGTDYLNQITTDLTAQTGLTYSVSATGQLVYQTDASGNPVVATTTDASGATVQVGSQEARDIVTDAVSNTTTAYARITTGRSSAPVGGTMININPTQISTMTSGPNNVDPKTLGMGMTFMHETLHSALGGGLRDVPAGSGLGPTGAVVDRMNIVRSEMNSQGANYGQRTSYEGVTFSPTGTPAYLPFDANSLNNLQRGLVPATTSKYLQF